MRLFLGFAALSAFLMGCTPPIPDSAAGVGFEDYDSYRARIAASDRAVETQAPQTVPPPKSSLRNRRTLV